MAAGRATALATAAESANDIEPFEHPGSVAELLAMVIVSCHLGGHAEFQWYR